MPMNKRTESIRLKYLQDIYYEKLQRIAYDVYDEQLHNLIIRPEELDADIHQYFRHTQPSLQDFYSRYASQWEYFHEMDEASDAKFLQFLKNSAYPFFHEIPPGRPEREILSPAFRCNQPALQGMESSANSLFRQMAYVALEQRIQLPNGAYRATL